MVLHPSEILDVVVGIVVLGWQFMASSGMVGFQFPAPTPSEKDSKQIRA